jgi:flagellar biosynthesis/type III secretory pathway protein FliH
MPSKAEVTAAYIQGCKDGAEAGMEAGYNDGWERGFDAGVEDSEDTMPHSFPKGTGNESTG